MLAETQYTEICISKEPKGSDGLFLGKVEINFNYLKGYAQTQLFASCSETFIAQRASKLFNKSDLFFQEVGIVIYLKNDLDFARIPMLIESIRRLETVFNERTGVAAC